MTLRLPFFAAGDLPQAAAAVREVIRDHGVCAFPTETFYGLGCDPRDPEAVARVFALKGRSADKALPVVAADVRQVLDLAAIEVAWLARLTAVWPAPLTVVLPVQAPLAAAGPSVAVRIPSHALLRSLLARVGPLTATSANPAGAAPTFTGDAALTSLGPGLDLLLDGGDTAGGMASTLVDLTRTPPILLRAGSWLPPREWGVKTA